MKLLDRSKDGPLCVLGLMVAARTLQGVLLERDDGGTRVVRHLSRQRSGVGGGGGFEMDAPVGVPGGAEEEAGDDFTIQFGGGGDGASNLFLGSEFGDVGEGGGKQSAAAPFVLELQDMLAECRDAGYDPIEVAFCLPASAVDHRELHIAGEAGADAAPGGHSEKKLFKLLEDQYEGVLERERVAFLPMMPTAEGTPRYQALVGQATDPVVATLRALRDQDGDLPAARLLDTEASLYLGLARAAHGDDLSEDEGTLVVRAGMDDTFVLFMQGGTLQQFETLPLTAHDAPETICSRVLLLQDEYGIGDVEHVLLMSDDQEAEFVESFEMFFAEARVSALRDYLPGQGSDEAFEAPGTVVPATGVALRHAGHAGYRDFEAVNLLPKKILRRRFTMPVSATSLALSGLVLCAIAFFAFVYVGQAAEIDERQQRLESFPEAEVDADPRRVQASIDSLQAISNNYTRGLEVLDELLLGSDQWSQALAKISRQTAAVRGIWVDGWTPTQTEVELSGSATSRDRIVNLAERTGGSIQSVTFSEIRDWPVFSFSMSVPLETGLPEATRYLRQQALAEQNERDSQDALATDAVPDDADAPVAPAAMTDEEQE